MSEISGPFQIDLFVAIMPGLIIAAFVQQPFALLIPLYSICAVIPFRQHQKIWLFFLHVHLIFLLSALFFIIKIHLINCLILLAFSLFFGYLDAHLKELKVLSAWFFIGVLYGDAEMRNDLAALTPHTLLYQSHLKTPE